MHHAKTVGACSYLWCLFSYHFILNASGNESDQVMDCDLSDDPSYRTTFDISELDKNLEEPAAAVNPKLLQVEQFLTIRKIHLWIGYISINLYVNYTNYFINDMVYCLVTAKHATNVKKINKQYTESIVTPNHCVERKNSVPFLYNQIF